MWEVVGIVIGVLWGIGYTIIRPSGLEHSPFILNIYYGVFYTICNTIGSICIQDVQHPEHWMWSKTQVLYFLAYAVCMTFATILYNIAAMKSQVQISVLTALTCCYPIVTWLGGLLFFKEPFIWKHLLGSLCIVAGASIISI